MNKNMLSVSYIFEAQKPISASDLYRLLLTLDDYRGKTAKQMCTLLRIVVKE